MTYPCAKCYNQAPNKYDDCEDWRIYVRKVTEEELEREVIISDKEWSWIRNAKSKEI